jgi:putative colanic acid biosynthesis acetyltransferase WcaF
MPERPPPHPQHDSSHSVRNRLARGVWGVAWALLFRPSPRVFHRWRILLLKLFGAKIQWSARVYPRARIWAPWRLTMGHWTCIADDVDVYNTARVTLHEYATVSHYGYLCTASHDFDDVRHPLITAPIVIGQRAWLAADVFVGPGVTIGEGTVVGARSGVFNDLPAWVLAAGTPAKPIRPRKLGPDDFRTV